MEFSFSIGGYIILVKKCLWYTSLFMCMEFNMSNGVVDHYHLVQKQKRSLWPITHFVTLKYPGFLILNLWPFSPLLLVSLKLKKPHCCIFYFSPVFLISLVCCFLFVRFMRWFSSHLCQYFIGLWVLCSPFLSCLID